MPPYNNPIGSMRLGNIFSAKPAPSRPAFGSGMFNPMQDTSDNPYQQGKFGNQKRLFSGIVPEQKYEPPPPQDDGMDYFNRLREFSKPGPAQTDFRKALNEVPQSQDYRRGGWGTAGAALAGGLAGFAEGPGAGVATATNFLRTPYNNALQDYETRMRGLESAAEMEMQDSQSGRGDFVEATRYADARGDRDFNRGLQTQDRMTAIYKAQTELQHALDQQARWREQGENERDRNIIADAVQKARAKYDDAMIGINRTNAGANVTRAGAAVTSANAAQTAAGAAVTRANRPANPPRITQMSEDDAWDQAMKEMLTNNEPGLSANPNDMSPTAYRVDPKFQATIEAKARARVQELIRNSRNVPGAAPPPPPEEPEDDDPYDVGDPFSIGGR